MKKTDLPAVFSACDKGHYVDHPCQKSEVCFLLDPRSRHLQVLHVGRENEGNDEN